jgi:hypothetical protein
MENIEEKIIDLVDVIAEPDPSKSGEKTNRPVAIPRSATFAEVQTQELELLVRSEVDRLIRGVVEENIQKMMQEIEKAIAREMENLKRN